MAAGLVLGAIVALAPIATMESLAEVRVDLAPPGPSSARAEAAATEISRVPYQAYLAADCITGSNFCKFTSTAVPRHRRLELHRVACQGWHASDTPPNFVTIAELQTAAGAYVRRIDFLDAPYTRVGTNTVWTINQSVLIFIPSAHRLRISLNSASTGVGSYGCTLSGYLVTTRA
jgi:hypothetical protein